MPRTDFVNSLRELCIVFRAESGIPCRAMLDAGPVYCSAAVGDAINRGVSVLLGHVSKRGRATVVAVTAETQLDGAVLVSVEVYEPGEVSADAAAPAVRARLEDLQGRLTALGVRMDVDAQLQHVRFALPRQLLAAD